MKPAISSRHSQTATLVSQNRGELSQPFVFQGSISVHCARKKPREIAHTTWEVQGLRSQERSPFFHEFSQFLLVLQRNMLAF